MDLAKLGLALQAGGLGFMGGNPNSVIQPYLQEQQDAETSQKVAGMLSGLGIQGPQADLISSMPLGMQQQYLMNRMQTQEQDKMRRRAAAEAASIRQRQIDSQNAAFAEYLPKPTPDAQGPTIAAANKPMALSREAIGRAITDPRLSAEQRKMLMDAYEFQNPAPPSQTDDIKEYEFARAQGYEGTLTDFMQDNRRAGAPSVDVTLPDGSPRAEVIGTQGSLVVQDDSAPGGYRWIVAAGSPADLQAQADAREVLEGEEQSENRQTQERLKLGTTLTSLAMNIAEIENGGLPVTGPVGRFRRTGVGQMLTGTDAVEMQVRSDQITDAAALAEIQRMRDNSKTGGAVGQLTDGERVAIGNAVTAINTATGDEEYLRAARAFRELSLNLAYGEGQWILDERTGEVLVNAPAPSSSGAPEGVGQDLWDIMTPEERAAWD